MADKNLEKRSVPFVFITTGTNKATIKVAYDLTVQCFFLKLSTFTELKNDIDLIIRIARSVCTECRMARNRHMELEGAGIL